MVACVTTEIDIVCQVLAAKIFVTTTLKRITCITKDSTRQFIQHQTPFRTSLEILNLNVIKVPLDKVSTLCVSLKKSMHENFAML